VIAIASPDQKITGCRRRNIFYRRDEWTLTVIGYIKGKSAIHLARVYGEKKRNFVGQHFWARGYFVSTVGRDEAVIRDYIRHQEQEDQRIDQLSIWN
jgi:REP element-mobilizing transposase RayT